MNIRYLGHSAFELSDGDTTVLIDPFLTGNPAATRTADEIACDYVLITHAHGDHISDAEAILRRTGATCVTTNEIAGDLAAKGIEAHGMHLGGKQSFDFGSVKLVLALHGSGVSGGHACGFLIESEGKKLYFAGDTALTTDMQLLRDVWGPIDIAVLPVGSYFTMDVPDAAVACRQIARHLRPDQVVLSVVTGVSCAAVCAALGGHRRVLRAMPNTSSAIGASATALCAPPGARAGGWGRGCGGSRAPAGGDGAAPHRA